MVASMANWCGRSGVPRPARRTMMLTSCRQGGRRRGWSVGTVLSSLMRVATTGYGEAGQPAATPRRCPQPPGAARWIAVTTYVQNYPGWPSPSARDSQATERCRSLDAVSHRASNVALPNPAGAETSVSLARRPSSSIAVWLCPCHSTAAKRVSTRNLVSTPKRACQPVGSRVLSSPPTSYRTRLTGTMAAAPSTAPTPATAYRTP